MFPMTITLTNETQLSAVLAALGAKHQAVEVVPPVVVENPKPPKAEKEAEPKVGEKKPDAPAAEPAQQSTASEDAHTAAQAVTYDDVKKAVLDVSHDRGRDAAVALLAGFGLKNAQEAKPEQWAEIMAAAKALV